MWNGEGVLGMEFMAGGMWKGVMLRVAPLSLGPQLRRVFAAFSVEMCACCVMVSQYGLECFQTC